MAAEISRRELLGGASIALALGAIGCSDDKTGALPNDNCPEPEECPEPEQCPPPTECPPQDMKSTQMPYRSFIPDGFRFDIAKAKEAGYHGYYEGGCAHGAFVAFYDQLVALGAPFDRLPRDLMRFGGGGIASYGSICGAVLGGIMIENLIVADPADAAAPRVRNPMMTELMRWYEKTPFPSYLPAANDAKETGTTLDFSRPEALKVIPASHLCHASVSSWCRANGVSSASGDKKARCSRLTADVVEKIGEMLNAHLASSAYAATPMDPATAACTSCHTSNTVTPPTVTAGMSCNACHGDPHPNW